jgi:hypothetical protein
MDKQVNLIVVNRFHDFITDKRAPGSTLMHATECGCRCWFSTIAQEMVFTKPDAASICVEHILVNREKYDLTQSREMPGQREAMLAMGYTNTEYEESLAFYHRVIGLGRGNNG